MQFHFAFWQYINNGNFVMRDILAKILQIMDKLSNLNLHVINL